MQKILAASRERSTTKVNLQFISKDELPIRMIPETMFTQNSALAFMLRPLV